jgi:hypothetical protein
MYLYFQVRGQGKLYMGLFTHARCFSEVYLYKFRHSYLFVINKLLMRL